MSRPSLSRSLLALPALIVGLLATVPAGASAATPSPGTFPYCSWWAKTTPETLNVAFPDAAATYWTTPFYAEPGLEIKVEGTYPDARYMSFNVYDEAGGSFETNGVSSGIADYQIEPNAGSVNPFQNEGEAGGSFTVTLSGAAKPGDANALPLAPEGEAGGTTAPLGFLLYRVYLPTGGDTTVQMPQLKLVKDGREVTLPRCPAPSGKLATAVRSKVASTKVAKYLGPKLQGEPTTQILKGLLKLGKAVRGGESSGTQPCRGSACPPAMKFFRASAESTNSFFPNVNNAYVSALIRPVAGKVIVVRGKAPTTPSGTSPVPWPQSSLQLRYFSLCNNVYRSPWPVVANPTAAGGTEYGCAADFETKLNARGEYGYVVAQPSLRGAIEKAGGTFIPLSATQPHARQILIFRNMLPNESFTHAVQNAPADASPEGAAKAMGPYYPRDQPLPYAGPVQAGAPACGSAVFGLPTGLRSDRVALALIAVRAEELKILRSSWRRQARTAGCGRTGVWKLDSHSTHLPPSRSKQRAVFRPRPPHGLGGPILRRASGCAPSEVSAEPCAHAVAPGL